MLDAVDITTLPMWDNARTLRTFLTIRNPERCDCDKDCVFVRLWNRLEWLEAL